MTTLNFLFELRESEIGNVVQRGPRTGLLAVPASLFSGLNRVMGGAPGSAPAASRVRPGRKRSGNS